MLDGADVVGSEVVGRAVVGFAVVGSAVVGSTVGSDVGPLVGDTVGGVHTCGNRQSSTTYIKSLASIASIVTHTRDSLRHRRFVSALLSVIEFSAVLAAGILIA